MCNLSSKQASQQRCTTDSYADFVPASMTSLFGEFQAEGSVGLFVLTLAHHTTAAISVFRCSSCRRIQRVTVTDSNKHVAERRAQLNTDYRQVNSTIQPDSQCSQVSTSCGVAQSAGPPKKAVSPSGRKQSGHQVAAH